MPEPVQAARTTAPVSPSADNILDAANDLFADLSNNPEQRKHLEDFLMFGKAPGSTATYRSVCQLLALSFQPGFTDNPAGVRTDFLITSKVDLPSMGHALISGMKEFVLARMQQRALPKHIGADPILDFCSAFLTLHDANNQAPLSKGERMAMRYKTRTDPAKDDAVTAPDQAQRKFKPSRRQTEPREAPDMQQVLSWAATLKSIAGKLLQAEQDALRPKPLLTDALPADPGNAWAHIKPRMPKGREAPGNAPRGAPAASAAAMRSAVLSSPGSVALPGSAVRTDSSASSSSASSSGSESEMEASQVSYDAGDDWADWDIDEHPGALIDHLAPDD